MSRIPEKREYKIYFSVLLILCWSGSSFAKGFVYNYNTNCMKAYGEYMSLHIAEGNAAIKQEIIQNPYNLMVTYLSDYDDYYTLLLNGDEREYEQRKMHIDQRLDLLSQGDENSPWYKLCKAGIYLHWALIHTRFGENFKATLLFRKSFILLKENKKQFPDFAYNDFFYGLEEGTVGAIPDDYKWIASLFGLRGSIREGLAKMGNFIDTHKSGDIFHSESVIFYNFMKFYLLHKQEDVWKFLNSEQFLTQNNLMDIFVKANMALNYRKADIAIQTFKEATAINDYNKYPIFEYQQGCALFLNLDPTCVEHFRSFIMRYKGKLFIKDAWSKMALAYYLMQNTAQADYCRAKIKTEGNTLVDVDKTASRFGNTTYWPNANLLRAHLLIDGGYYKQAYEMLSNINEQSLTNLSDKLEYSFRLARVYDEMGQKDKALRYYQTTINVGRNERDYFAARAALQMAFVYEKVGNTNEAIARFKECLSIRHHDFQNAIDQQAKAGINRLTVK